MDGKAMAPAMAAGAVVRNVRRLYLRVVLICSFSREGAGIRLVTAAILPYPAAIGAPLQGFARRRSIAACPPAENG